MAIRGSFHNTKGSATTRITGKIWTGVVRRFCLNLKHNLTKRKFLGHVQHLTDGPEMIKWLQKPSSCPLQQRQVTPSHGSSPMNLSSTISISSSFEQNESQSSCLRPYLCTRKLNFKLKLYQTILTF